MIVIHGHLMDNWYLKSTTTTSFSVPKLGPNLKGLQKRDIITSMEDTTPKSVFEFYTMLQNQPRLIMCWSRRFMPSCYVSVLLVSVHLALALRNMVKWPRPSLLAFIVTLFPVKLPICKVLPE